MHSLRKFKFLTLIMFLSLVLCGSTYAAESLVNLMNREARTAPAKRIANGVTLTAARGSSYIVRSPQRISLRRGLIRVTVSAQQKPVVVTTPYGNITITNADVVVFVGNGRTRAVKISNAGVLTMNSTGRVVTANQANQELSSTPLQAASAANSNDTSRNNGRLVVATAPTTPPTTLPNIAGSVNNTSGINYESNLTASPFTRNRNTVDNANGDINGSNQIATRYTDIDTDSQQGRSRGLTTNKVYTSNESFNQLLLDNTPVALQNIDSESDIKLTQQSYEFVTDSDGSINLIIKYEDLSEFPDNSVTPGIVGESTSVKNAAIILSLSDEDGNNPSISPNKILSITQKNILDENQGNDTPNEVGNQFSNEANYQLLAVGFENNTLADSTGGIFPNGIPTVTRTERDNNGIIEKGNFIMLEVNTSKVNPLTSEIEILDPDALNHHYVFAAGDVISKDQSLEKISVDKFFISAGLNGYDPNTPNDPESENSKKNKTDDIRAFALSNTANEATAKLTDSGLLVVNQPATDGNETPSRVLHTDFNLSGTKAEQTSTISTTLGQVEYLATRSGGGPSPDDANDVVLAANTLGSSQGGEQKLVSFHSTLQNTSAGGGADGGSGPGYADFFVLENHDNSFNTEGGTEHIIGGDINGEADRRYAYLRLASINGANQTVANHALTREKAADSLEAGYIAGLAHTEISSGEVSVGYLLSTDDPSTNLSIKKIDDSSSSPTDETATDYSSLNGNITFSDASGNSRTLTLDQGTYVDDQRYAATNGDATLVSSGLVKAGIDQRIADNIDVPEYMEWGFFFGDTNPSDTSVSHAHLASWVAGAVTAPGDIPTTGTATYTGSALGNVFEGGNSYVASGTYQNSWNFGTRRGTAELNFDGQDYTGNTAFENANSSQFIGALNNSNNTREAGLQGSFVQNQNGNEAAAGVMGQFYIQGTDNSDYRAAGTFAADKTSN